ncbi:hypothetical protein KIN20_020502 [Parelaphostrongylus tenuis]|uniref:Uncharacterized protein n=1 Tax=Parelaphostrongylus tenuis TaxID=148309 RepID=A0AAD5QVK6_PARTN|nr:hypothetical protein KIN20_020502 [Parelaphostrongylus tenuis]
MEIKLEVHCSLNYVAITSKSKDSMKTGGSEESKTAETQVIPLQLERVTPTSSTFCFKRTVLEHN